MNFCQNYKLETEYYHFPIGMSETVVHREIEEKQEISNAEKVEKLESASNKTKMRSITGAILAIICAITSYFSLSLFHIAESVVTGMMLFEYLSAIKSSKEDIIMSYVLFAAQHIMTFYDMYLPISVFPVLCFLVLSVYALATHRSIQTMKLFFGLIWAVHLIHFLLAECKLANTTFVGLYSVFYACWNDSWQYCFGRLFGKHKPLTYLSPGKSIEGYIGGFLMVALIGFLAEESILFIVLVFFAGVVGDLIASCLKRELGVKDYGDCLPGMGGMFDRLDSIAFVVTVTYYYYYFFGWHPKVIISCILKYAYFTDDKCFD